jgi:2-oxoisovalerate dehydrogenase E2 component (dihydrolipoyl transacylase)
MPTNTLTTITMPQLGESVIEGTIGAWLKQLGDHVDKYESLVEVETDKANAEMPAPVSGVLVEILVEPGSTVAVGTDLCRIQEEGVIDPVLVERGGQETGASNGNREAPSVPAQPRADKLRTGEIPDEATLLRTRSSPVVRRTAEEFGIDIAQVEGTGAGGRVTKRDILAHIAGRSGSAPELYTRDRAVGPAVEPRAAVTVYPGDEVMPVTPMRRMVAEHMVRSARTAPHATVVMEVDMTRAVAYRAARKEEFRRREGVDLTYLPIVMKGVSLALADHPRLNAVWDEERIIHRRAINIGIAVGLEDGLVVPVVKNADRLSLAGLAHAVADLAGKARAGGFAPDDLVGGTITVNNPGTFGSLVSTPILVQPQVAILSTEAIIKRPVVVDDMIAIRSMMNLSLSIDHRALDGLAAARFLQQVKQWLESVSDDLPLY